MTDTRDHYRELHKDVIGLILHMKQFNDELDPTTYRYTLEALNMFRIDVTNRRDKRNVVGRSDG